MEDKEAIIKMSAYYSYDSSKLSEQQAMDKLEEILNELDEKHGICVNIHERSIGNR